MYGSKRLAVVTGASSGIGAELTNLFVHDGYDVIAVAEGIEPHCYADYPDGLAGTITAVQADLRTTEGVDTVVAAVDNDGRALSAAALNAGIGCGGTFAETDLADIMSVIDLNIRGTVRLASFVVRHMLARGSGRILITSSVASMMPGPNHVVYNATKSFLQSFAEGLASEASDGGVTVTALMPGPTDTQFFRRAGLENTIMGRLDKDEPAAVARAGYDAMNNGKRKVVAASVLSKAMAAVSTVTPDSVKARAHRILAEPSDD
ncbi:SDR family NAD(P)-dependent oxidoreductase [Rhodococcus sovatensis]|uniref:SDR family NAD(P)-dependent oxidoreductase n=1 Tax=Rhodococcus sovatensis TaxID=1805840 RepID=A0ABZ2PJQ3_9NOCA